MFLFLFLLSNSFGAIKSIDQVRTFDVHKHEVQVTLWGNSRVFRIDENSPVVPCLENGKKSGMRVEIDVDTEGEIVGCKLASLPVPGLTGPAR